MYDMYKVCMYLQNVIFIGAGCEGTETAQFHEIIFQYN